MDDLPCDPAKKKKRIQEYDHNQVDEYDTNI